MIYEKNRNICLYSYYLSSSDTIYCKFNYKRLGRLPTIILMVSQSGALLIVLYGMNINKFGKPHTIMSRLVEAGKTRYENGTS